jgi:hypothetical protein
MKYYVSILCVISSFTIFSQNDCDFNSGEIIELKINKVNNNSNLITNFFCKKNDTYYRSLEFNIKFGNGTNYILTGNDAQYQNHWNKVVTIACTEDFQKRNSLRLGWRYIPNLSKIELGFYAHIDHTDGILNEEGREFTSLGVFVDIYSTINVEIYFSKFDYYIRVLDKGIHIHRDVMSWDVQGEQTRIHLNAYFGDMYDEWKDEKAFGAYSNMYFYISNIFIDRGTYLHNNKQNTAPYLGFLNTIFYQGDTIIYNATNQINLSIYSESNWERARDLEYEWVTRSNSFTVFEPGSNIQMYSPSILIDKGTIIKQGALCIFGPNN